MSPQNLYNLFSGSQVILSLTTLALLIRGRDFKAYWPLLFVSTWEVIPYLTFLGIRQFGPSHHLTAQHAYTLYFYTYWSCFAVQAICAIILTYVILSAAMHPLKGLHSLGKIVYFWAAGISAVVALDNAISPSADSYALTTSLVAHLQRASGFIIFSLILFVCFAIRPMGLSLRSRIFGVSLGLGITSLTSAIQANYFAAQHRKLFSTYSVVQIATSCVADVIWIYYFAVPEPKRKFVLLPTTSPFHHWNRISELLGQEPGYVAIGGVPPESFAMAEIDIFKRASAKMKALEDQDKDALLPLGRG